MKVSIFSFMKNDNISTSAKLLLVFILPMHAFFLYSIFDIYFTSPLIPDVQLVPVNHSPLAKRLVLFVIDGLPAKKLYFGMMDDTLFLKKVMSNGSSWGLSHTRVPTETRPGHVALIAGFYEDVSSITKGWRANAVEFDSIFNHSYKTWAWGSPDVLPMFQKGVEHGKINVSCYDESMEDFAVNETWKLDTWVFDRVRGVLDSTKYDLHLNTELRNDRVILFLHLLGLDVSGHSQKPNSRSYRHNMQIVDQGIEEMTRLISDFYGDGATAYLVTSDHGMTNWGSHGAGSDDETITPVIAWGSGFATKKSKSTGQIYNFDFKFSPELCAGFRNDIHQADLTPLMAALLAIPIPINSVGYLPDDYLNVDNSVKVNIIQTNILQLFAQFKKKHDSIRKSKILAFHEYNDLTMAGALETLKRGETFTAGGNFESAIELYKNLSFNLIGGLNYYHKYDQMWLSFLVSSTFIFWIVLLGTFMCQPRSSQVVVGFQHYVVLAIVFGYFILLQTVQNQSMTYLLYQTVPIALLWILYVYRRLETKSIFQYIKDNLLFAIAVVLLSESLIWCFFYRQILSLGVIMTYLVGLFGTRRRISFQMLFKWTISCCVLIIYPNLPIIAGDKSITLVTMGAVCNVSLSFYLYLFNKVSSDRRRFGLNPILILICLQIVILFHVLYCQARIQSGTGLPLFSMCFSWICLLFFIPIICSTPTDLVNRFHMLFIAMASIYNMLSIFYEMFFMLSLTCFCLTWLELEITYRKQQTETSAIIDKRKIVQTIVYIFFVTYSFFGTGNIASINSFDVSATYCFVTLFRPFVMMILFIVKLLLPMAIVSLTYVMIQTKRLHQILIQNSGQSLKMNRQRIDIEEICLVTIISDFAALHFLFLIRDHGSWLEIGISISHYVIAMSMCISTFLLTLCGKYILTVSPLKSDVHELKTR